MKLVIYQKRHVIQSTGGAEKVICDLASELQCRGIDVHLVSNEKALQGKPFFHIGNGVAFTNVAEENLRPLNLLKARLNARNILLKRDSARLLAFLGQLKPDVIVASSPREAAELLDNGVNIKIILMFHKHPKMYLENRKPEEIDRFHSALLQVAAVQVLLPSYKDYLRMHFGVAAQLIGNAVPQLQHTDHANVSNKIVYIGRLHKDKNHSLLLHAFTKLKDRFPAWSVDIWGEGPHEKQVADEVHALGISDRVFLKGKTTVPLDILAAADICAFPSLHEGFPLALTEAMSCSLPCLGLVSASGVNELIQDGENGLLSDNTAESFAEKLAALMESKQLRQRLGRAAKKTVAAYAPENIWDQWEALIRSTQA